MSSGGLTLLVTGLIVIVSAARTRGIAPDRPFVPHPITNPRMWFVLTWGVGIAVAVSLSFLQLPEVVEQLIMLVFSLSLMVAGSVWALRWLSGQRVKFWPANSELLLRWVPSWTVLWAGVWGAVSTCLAIVIEAAPILVLAVLSGTAFDEVPQLRLSSFEGITRAIHNPALLAAIFAGAVIGAPLVEEAVKAAGLRGLRRWIQRPADGWLLGFTMGLGFGLLEGAFNLDTTQNWFLGGWVRLAALLLHGLATSLTGFGYARYLQTQQRGELWRGYRGAVIMHGHVECLRADHRLRRYCHGAQRLHAECAADVHGRSAHHCPGDHHDSAYPACGQSRCAEQHPGRLSTSGCAAAGRLVAHEVQSGLAIRGAASDLCAGGGTA